MTGWGGGKEKRKEVERKLPCIECGLGAGRVGASKSHLGLQISSFWPGLGGDDREGKAISSVRLSADPLLTPCTACSPIRHPTYCPRSHPSGR